ncbi:20740_t:CDS:2, partial [Gigaspora rosea]
LTNIKTTISQISSSFVSTPMSTIDGGYAIINANCSPQDANSNRILAVRCVLSADFISYNEISQDRTAILYQINHQNITFNGVYCDLVSAGVGQVCTISVSYPITVNNSIVNNNSTVNNSTIPANNTANNTMSTTEYIKVNFLSSGSVPSNIDMEAMDREVSKELNEMINKLFEKLHNKIKKIIEDVSCDISKKINEICSNIKDISHKIHDKIDGEKIHEIISNISNDYRRISHIMPKISNSGISASKDSESINAQLTPDMQEAIIAKVRDEVLIVLLDKLFELLQDEFFKLLDGNICEYLEKEMNEILSNKAINKGGVLDAIIDENDEESSGTKDVRNVKNELQPNEVVGKLLGKISKQTKKEIIGKILEKISSQLKKTFSFKIKGKIRSKTCLPEFAKLLKQIGNISDVLKNVSNEADEDKFYEEMQHMIHKLSDEIQHKLNELVTKFSEKMKEVLNDTVKEISTKVQNQIAGEMKKEDSNQEKGSQKNEQVKIEEAPQKSLTDTFKSLLKHDEEAANTAKSMFILFVIVDSESFLILDNATKNNISSETHKRRAHNRSLLGMVKSFSIIIIM